MNRLRFLTSPLRILPDYVIAGEAKCGTTSLYRYLLQHPSVLPADEKEPNNFRHFGASPLFCRAHFPLVTTRAWRRMRTGAAVAGEASAEYFSKPEVPEAIARVVPEARIIVLLRHPARRAFSDFQMLSRAGRETRPFEQVVEQSLDWLGRDDVEPLLEALDQLEYHPLRFLLRGMYVRPLRRWQRVFPPERLLCLQSEHLFADPAEALTRVHRFLGLPEAPAADLAARKRGKYAGTMPDDCAEQLAAFYRPWNELLYDEMGTRFNWDAEGS